MQTCIGFGGCGFGGLCCFAPSLGCGCLRYCHRAKGSKILTVDGENSWVKEGRLYKKYNYQNQEDELLSYSSPDDEFFACCKDRGLPMSCLNKCSYSAYSGTALRNMFLRIDECPVRAANDLHLCATRGRDHRSCCYRNGVTTTMAGHKCLLFCQKPPENQTQIDLSYMPCYDRFDTMRKCFWQDASREYQVRSLAKSMSRKMVNNYIEF